jgi:hypothetical protein
MQQAYNGFDKSGKNFAAFARGKIHFTLLTRCPLRAT